MKKGNANSIIGTRTEEKDEQLEVEHIVEHKASLLKKLNGTSRNKSATVRFKCRLSRRDILSPFNNCLHRIKVSNKWSVDRRFDNKEQMQSQQSAHENSIQTSKF